MRLIDYFFKGLERGADAPFLTSETGSLSYGEADRLSARIAAGLQTAGCADDVAVMAPNDAIGFICLLGILRAGGKRLLVNPRNTPALNARLLQRVGCRAIIYHSSLAGDVAEIRSLCPKITAAICMDEAPSGTGADMSLEALMALSQDPPSEFADDPERVISYSFTGGTTGEPKAVRANGRMWETAIATLWQCCPTENRPVHIVAGPITHAAGGLVIMLMCAGTENIILPDTKPETILQAIATHRATHIYLPPTLLYTLLDAPSLREYDCTSLEYMVLTAAPVSPERLREAVEVFGRAPCQVFGQAEAPMILTYLSNADLQRALAATSDAIPKRFSSCGRATLQSRVEIMDDEGRLLAAGERGEIVARGALVFPGYLDNEEATREASRFGWHHTGDVGFKDGEGFVYIVDRKKDMIVTGGFNVFSVEVENVIAEHPSVAECAVIGVPDEKWGEAVKAVVSLKPGSSANASDLIALVKQRLGSVHAPKSVEFWDALPKSPNGKLLKTEVRKAFWANAERLV